MFKRKENNYPVHGPDFNLDRDLKADYDENYYGVSMLGGF